MLDHFRAGIVAEAGLFAHGRGEAFDYLIGERTTAAASRASDAAAAALLTAKHPGIENGVGRVLTKQIAGFVARRIVAPVKPGDTAVAGERFGMIRFGSRVDVVVPESSQVQVKVGDRAVAGETVLAVLT